MRINTRSYGYAMLSVWWKLSVVRFCIKTTLHDWKDNMQIDETIFDLHSVIKTREFLLPLK